ncbi:hypothetical protein K1T35_48590 (plasmid) [Pseudonocardia sp. DSM 110487]|uniref:hypothetical protein n=1 Tax=Pseudonocardia sp. DSM 110487 TaxID=2865833 RepID=UPI001C6A61AE|nr:hypothetical protein [Pseudonocardia sp. DSM 110487]QYN41207.1 hypothetical protein K1T35_48590 [Pseudonocardia sp. DSM 110487]
MSDLIKELRDALAVFRECEQTLSELGEADEQPTDNEVWARDDSGVEVARVADRLMAEVDHGLIELHDVSCGVKIEPVADVRRRTAAEPTAYLDRLWRARHPHRVQ